MTAEIYAEYLRHLGHKVLRTASAYWFDAAPRVFSAFPFHAEIAPTGDELSRVFKQAWCVRFLSKNDGRDSYYYACADKTYDVAQLGQKTRKNTRRALRMWNVTRVDCDWLSEHGAALDAQTRVRQGRTVRHAREEWRQKSVIAPIARGQVSGLGWRGYWAALEALVAQLEGEE